MEQDAKRKGGRIPAKNFKFYGQDAIRSSNTRLAKTKFGSLAVDCIQCAHERMAQSDFALFRLDDTNLRRIELEEQITKEEFLEVMDYCTKELRMFDQVLFANGILFSVEFVRTFEMAGLFRHRTYGLADILRVANHYRPGHPPITAEDELELIAKGGSSLTPHEETPNGQDIIRLKDSDFSRPETMSGRNKDVNPEDQELPF